MKQFNLKTSRRQWMALTAAACAAFSVGAQAQSAWPTTANRAAARRADRQRRFWMLYR